MPLATMPTVSTPAWPFTLDAFQAWAQATGFDAVLVREWAAHVVVPTHTHPFAAHAVMTQGELWLTCGDQTRHLKPGDTFELAPAQPHAERYGPLGGTYWVASRNAPD